MPRKKPGRRAKTTGTDARSKIVSKSKSADARRTKKGRLVTTATLDKIGAVRVATKVDLGSLLGAIGARHPAEFRIPFRRPDDLLICDFVFENLRVSGAAPPKLVRKNPERFATLIVEFPPQSFGEEAFIEQPGAETPPKPPPSPRPDQIPPPPPEPVPPLPSSRIRMAGRSRIAFTMPAEEKSLEFTLVAILDACRRWPMSLDINAAPDPQFSIGVLGEIFEHDWLAVLVSSENWRQTTDALVGGIGGGDALRQPLADAARRLAFRASQAYSRVIQQQGRVMLDADINEELDVIAKRFAPLRDAERRRTAFGALSLMSASAVAAERGIDFERFKEFPFLPLFFAPHEPAPNVTALELPYRVILSPIPQAAWVHDSAPVTHNRRTELWQTRLTGAPDGIGPDTPTKVRALWSPDYRDRNNPGWNQIIQLANDLKPFRMSLDPFDRLMLVELMSNFTDTTNRRFVPRAACAKRLALSALGALLDVEGSWEHLPKEVSLEQWRHLATLGRDHYVRVVYRGFLCPFQHPASLVKVTERKFESLPGSANRIAVLRQRFFIIVRKPVVQYTGVGHTFGGKNFPFTSVEILTKVTPSLRDPNQTAIGDPPPPAKPFGAIPKRARFWPMIDKQNDFLFQIAATDLCGDRVTFAMPLLFVGKEVNDDADATASIIAAYDAANPARRTGPIGGASVCYAPMKDGAPGDPKLPTETMTFKADGVIGIPAESAQFYPVVDSADVGIAALRRLLQDPQANLAVTYPEAYKNNGFGAGNAGEVFLKALSPFPLQFGANVKSDAIGGVATPDMAIQGLSRIMGPVAAKVGADVETALQNVIGNKFDPADFFADAKILGGVKLAELLKIAASLAGGDVPKFLSRELPDKIEASFDWQTVIKQSDGLGLFVHSAGGPTNFEMHGLVSSPIGKPDATTFNANASITNFKINLFGFITIWFDALTFIAKSGMKPDVSVDLHPGDQTVEFGGPLEFVNKLREIIPSNGFTDPPSLSVTPSGIAASYSLSLPSIGVGIFALEHVSLGAGFALPFDGKPAEVRFNFSERQRPFSLTVSLLGGGGFFALGVGAEGVKEIEAALEFGAAISIDLGVASGGVEIKAGVYFHWLQPTAGAASVELAGYVRLHGELSVLGLISASLTFNLQIAYAKEGGNSLVWGEATLEIEIDILFLSFSVSVKCRREFAGSAGDPKFIELIPDQDTWDDYCGAFDKEAA